MPKTKKIEKELQKKSKSIQNYLERILKRMYGFQKIFPLQNFQGPKIFLNKKSQQNTLSSKHMSPDFGLAPIFSFRNWLL